MVKICLLFIKNMLNINLQHTNYCFNIVLPLFTYTNLVYVNINIGIFIFKCGTLSKFGLRTWCVNSNKYGIEYFLTAGPGRPSTPRYPFSPFCPLRPGKPPLPLLPSSPLPPFPPDMPGEPSFPLLPW